MCEGDSKICPASAHGTLVDTSWAVKLCQAQRPSVVWACEE